MRTPASYYTVIENPKEPGTSEVSRWENQLTRHAFISAFNMHVKSGDKAEEATAKKVIKDYLTQPERDNLPIKKLEDVRSLIEEYAPGAWAAAYGQQRTLAETICMGMGDGTAKAPEEPATQEVYKEDLGVTIESNAVMMASALDAASQILHDAVSDGRMHSFLITVTSNLGSEFSTVG